MFSDHLTLKWFIVMEIRDVKVGFLCQCWCLFIFPESCPFYTCQTFHTHQSKIYLHTVVPFHSGHFSTTSCCKAKKLDPCVWFSVYIFSCSFTTRVKPTLLVMLWVSMLTHWRTCRIIKSQQSKTLQTWAESWFTQQHVSKSCWLKLEVVLLSRGMCLFFYLLFTNLRKSNHKFFCMNLWEMTLTLNLYQSSISCNYSVLLNTQAC